jgi:hypothetical protein
MIEYSWGETNVTCLGFWPSGSVELLSPHLWYRPDCALRMAHIWNANGHVAG